MATTSTTWTEETITLAGTEVQMVTGGTGEPLLIFHDEMGHQSWLRYHEALAQHHRLYIPSHPGFGKTPALPWIMNMRDMAGWYLQALDDLGLGRVNVAGFSLGGWLASELATMCPHQFKKLVLVGPMGIKPPIGDIYDMFLEVAHNFITDGFLSPSNTEEFQQVCPDEPSPELTEAWEVAREEACRLGWRPYMYYPAMPDLLGRLKELPTLIVWGRQDAIVPLSAGQAYHEAIEGSRLAVLEDSGHRPEVEKSAEFIELVHQFLSEA
jgi:pimeloyl-ACP methyl ester carboxylesterase